MQTVYAAAPGKLMICGEYAVLAGAPALVMAVDREVKVSIRRSSATSGHVRALPLLEDALGIVFSSTDFWCDPERAHEQLGMTGRLLPILVEYLFSDSTAGERSAFDLEIDSSALFDCRSIDRSSCDRHSFDQRPGDSIKLGLGSSAAVTVALFRALARYAEHPIVDQSPQQQLNVLLPLYRKALQSPASGADLAASLFGGVVSVRPEPEQLKVHKLSWPEDLYWTAIWTLQAAQTTDYVGRFQRWYADDVNAARFVDDLSEAARVAETAMLGESAAGLIAALREYARRLGMMDQALTEFSADGISIMTPTHQVLHDRADAEHILYKSCGAGGGDLGIALSQDRPSLKAFTDPLSPAHARPLELRIASSTFDKKPI